MIKFHSSYVSSDVERSDVAIPGGIGISGEVTPSVARLPKGYAKVKKVHAIRTKEKTNKLCRSLKECLALSHHLIHLELFNIPLSVKDCAQIAKVV